MLLWCAVVFSNTLHCSKCEPTAHHQALWFSPLEDFLMWYIRSASWNSQQACFSLVCLRCKHKLRSPLFSTYGHETFLERLQTHPKHLNKVILGLGPAIVQILVFFGSAVTSPKSSEKDKTGSGLYFFSLSIQARWANTMALSIVLRSSADMFHWTFETLYSCFSRNSPFSSQRLETTEMHYMLYTVPDKNWNRNIFFTLSTMYQSIFTGNQ